LVVSSTSAAQALTREVRTRALLATPQLYLLDAKGQVQGTCSGSFIHPAGYIVTNFHCVGIKGEDDSGQGLRPGQLYHPKGWIAVAPVTDPKEAPKPAYLAQFLAGTPEFDIAVVKIFGTLDPKVKLPNRLPISTIKLGDSDLMEQGDTLNLVGYPGISGKAITLSTGQINSLDDQNRDGQMDAFVHNASSSGGSSGGPGLNDDGEQIGVHYGSVSDPNSAARFARMTMINIALPYIQRAIGLAGAQVGQVPEPGPQTAPTLPGTSATPPRGTTPAAPAPAPPAPPAPSGTMPTAPRGSTTTRPASPASPASPAPSADPTSLVGTIVDADTKRPVGSAAFLVLQPGVSVAMFDAATGKAEEAMVLALATTDTKGMFQTPAVFEPGAAYQLVVGANGYDRRSLTLTVRADAAGVLELQPIAIKRK